MKPSLFARAITTSTQNQNPAGSDLESKETRAALGDGLPEENGSIMCYLLGSPIEQYESNFSLAYSENKDRTKSITLFINIEEKDSVFFTVKMPLESQLSYIIGPLQKKAQAIGLPLQNKSKEVRYYICRGVCNKVEELFLVLKEQLMQNRCCVYGERLELISLYDLFARAYNQVKQNFAAQETQSNTLNSNSFGVSLIKIR